MNLFCLLGRRHWKVLLFLYLIKYPAVEMAAFAIVEPTEFAEIAHHAYGVGKEEAQASVRATAELVVYGNLREEERAVIAVYASGKVEILGIHEIALVKKPRFLQCAHAQEHEATGKARHVHRVLVAGVCQFVALVASCKHPFRQEHTAEHVHWSGQEFCQRLDSAVQEQYFWHNLSHLGMLLHVLPDCGDNIGREPYIGVHNQMVKAAFLHGQTYGTVVATAIPYIVLKKILYLETTLYVSAYLLVPLHVLLKFFAQRVNLVAMVYYPYLTYGRRNDRAQDGLYVQKVVVVCDYACRYHDIRRLALCGQIS